MIDNTRTLVARRLAKRVAKTQPTSPSISFDDTPTPAGLIDYLREHLAGGETHYTARPGIPDLRAAIGTEIGKLGGTARDADGVIITHGEGEALYVTLLGLGLGSESKLLVHGRCQHKELLDLLGIYPIDSNHTSANAAIASYRELATTDGGALGSSDDDLVEIVSVNCLTFSPESTEGSLKNTTSSAILIGNLDSVPGLDNFRLGFVAGPPSTVKKIQTWKQALSICTAGPSQRAALFAIEGRSDS